MTEQGIDFQLKYLEDVPEDCEFALGLVLEEGVVED